MSQELRLPPLEYWPLDRLVPYERNPRTHSKRQVAKLASLISQFGFTDPVLVDRDRGVVYGHGRILAARLLGLEEIPVIVGAHLTAEQVRAFRIAHNKIALEAGWDEQLLTEELEELSGAGFPLELTAFEERELDRLLGRGDAGGPEMPEGPENRVVFRVSCDELDGDALAGALQRAIRDSGLSGVKMLRL